MTNILDVAPNPRVVKTHTYGNLEVTGLSIGGIVHLIKSHPELFKMFNSEGKQMMELDKLMELGEEVVASFLAAGLGHPGIEKVIEKCKIMNPEDAWSLGEAILEESFPGGAANFFERVATAAKSANLIQISKTMKNQIPENIQEEEEIKLAKAS